MYLSFNPRANHAHKGATPAQARAALRKYNDVMQAAERIFDGAFDHITDDVEDVDMVSLSDHAGSSSRTRATVSAHATEYSMTH